MFISDDRLQAVADSLKPRSQYDFNECLSLFDVLVQVGYSPAEINSLDTIEESLLEKYGLYHCPYCDIWTDEQHGKHNHQSLACRRCYDFDND